MNKFIVAIVTSSVSLLFKALKFVPGIKQADVDAACDLAITQITAGKATFDQISGDTTEQVIVGMVVDGLNVTQAALDSTGDTKYDGWIENAETFLANFVTDGGHPVLAGLKTWIQKLFGKKKTV